MEIKMKTKMKIEDGENVKTGQTSFSNISIRTRQSNTSFYKLGQLDPTKPVLQPLKTGLTSFQNWFDQKPKTKNQNPNPKTKN